jgi:hypothetical protein
VIVVALVAVGAAIIAQYPDSSTRPVASGASPSPSASPTATQTGAGTGTGGGQQSPEPAQAVKVAVYNGTFQTGLAATVATRMEKKGYRINETWILDAPDKPVDLTTIYFVTPDDKSAAQAVADSFFGKLPDAPKVQRLPDNATVPNGVQVAVYIGLDYVNSQ